MAQVRRLLDEVPLDGDVLELAGGTGNWTEYLASRGAQVTVLDGSNEMLAINRSRMSSAGLLERVCYQKVDLFSWFPAAGRSFDAVYFSFWLSHVPASLLDRFFRAVTAALRDGGWLALLDSRPGAMDRSRHGTVRMGGDGERRELKSGRTYNIVKRFDQPAEIEARLAAEGIAASAVLTDNHFLVVTGQRRR